MLSRSARSAIATLTICSIRASSFHPPIWSTSYNTRRRIKIAVEKLAGALALCQLVYPLPRSHTGIIKSRLERFLVTHVVGRICVLLCGITFRSLVNHHLYLAQVLFPTLNHGMVLLWQHYGGRSWFWEALSFKAFRRRLSICCGLCWTFIQMTYRITTLWKEMITTVPTSHQKMRNAETIQQFRLTSARDIARPGDKYTAPVRNKAPMRLRHRLRLLRPALCRIPAK